MKQQYTIEERIQYYSRRVAALQKLVATLKPEDDEFWVIVDMIKENRDRLKRVEAALKGTRTP